MKNKKITRVNLLILLLLLSTIFSTYIIVKTNSQKDRLSSAHAAGNSWVDDFNGTTLDTNFWDISNDNPAFNSVTNSHLGIFQSDRVSVSGGYLTLKLTQENGQVGTNPNGVISRGGEVVSNDTYGYGTYEWRARMSSTASSPQNGSGKTVSGQISGLFNYINNSETELDFEVEGQYPNQIENTTWYNTHPATDPTDNDNTYSSAPITGMNTGFKTYKFIWSPGEVKYYVDDIMVADHTTHVPSAPANFTMNHWGTDSEDFGGMATVGVDRYLIFDWVRYTPPGATPPATSITPSIIPNSPILYCLGAGCTSTPRNIVTNHNHSPITNVPSGNGASLMDLIKEFIFYILSLIGYHNE